jgi:hypothetical protein
MIEPEIAFADLYDCMQVLIFFSQKKEKKKKECPHNAVYVGPLRLHAGVHTIVCIYIYTHTYIYII